MDQHDNALGEFLRARREQLEPQHVGLPDDGPRRVAGLRREELAALAGVSPHYYARLEQGRDRHPSRQVLDALSQALSLDDDAAAYLRRLAEPPATVPLPRPPRADRPRPGVAVLLDAWTANPAMVLDRRWDVLAANDLATTLYAGFSPARNIMRDFFLEPAAREAYADWDVIAAESVAGLRAAAGADPDDPDFTQLVGELSVKSEDFRELWARHEVHEKTAGLKRFHNPFVGLIELHYETFAVEGGDGQKLVVYFAEPGSAHQQSLTLLAAIARGES